MDARDDPRTRRPTAAGHVLASGVLGLVLALLLNAPALLETAEGLPLGFERTVATSVMRPVKAMSSVLFLDRPRALIEGLLGRGDAPTATEASSTVPDRSPPAADELDLSVRTPTAGDPADVWIIGDSLVELLGPHLSDVLATTGVVSSEVDFRFITGLSRPDYFDWPTYIRKRFARGGPDAVVVMFGGNDGQNVEHDGVVYEKWTPPWLDLYRERVAEAMDALRADRLRVYWVGLPIMRSETFSAHAREMNEVYRSEAADRPWVVFVPSWDLFTDASGRYADYLPDAEGDLELMRYGDGVHFTPQGARRLARHVFGFLATDFGIERPG